MATHYKNKKRKFQTNLSYKKNLKRSKMNLKTELEVKTNSLIDVNDSSKQSDAVFNELANPLECVTNSFSSEDLTCNKTEQVVNELLKDLLDGVFDELGNSELADPLESITNVNNLSEDTDLFSNDDKPTTDLTKDLLEALEEEKKTMSDEERKKYGSTIKNIIIAFKEKKLDFRKVCFSF